MDKNKLDKKLIGMKIKGIRMGLGMTMEEFGGKVGGAAGSIVSRWESGISVPNNERIKKIAEMAGENVQTIFLSQCICSVCEYENILTDYNYCPICGTKIKKEPTSVAPEEGH